MSSSEASEDVQRAKLFAGVPDVTVGFLGQVFPSLRLWRNHDENEKDSFGSKRFRRGMWANVDGENVQSLPLCRELYNVPLEYVDRVFI
jgi:hypothetical protein